MRHRVRKGRKLSRSSGQRKALMRNLLTTLLEFGHLQTTTAKAKEVKREFDILVNRAKRAQANNNLTIKRKIFSLLSKKEIGLKLFDEVLPKLSTRGSGYLTYIRTGVLRNDGAENVFLQFAKEEKDGGKKEGQTTVPSGKKLAPNRRRAASPRKVSGKNK